MVENKHAFSILGFLLVLQGFEGISERVFSDLTLLVPKRAKSLQMGSQTLLKTPETPSFFSIFCDLCPICGQIGPILSNTLGCAMNW